MFLTCAIIFSYCLTCLQGGVDDDSDDIKSDDDDGGGDTDEDDDDVRPKGFAAKSKKNKWLSDTLLLFCLTSYQSSIALPDCFIIFILFINS